MSATKWTKFANTLQLALAAGTDHEMYCPRRTASPHNEHFPGSGKWESITQSFPQCFDSNW